MDRELTEAEAAVVRSLLDSKPTNEQERIRSSGLPPRTYETARARVLGSQLIVERLVPNPSVIGWSSVQFSLSFDAGRRANRMDASRWSDQPGTVLVWEFGGVSAGVTFHRDTNGDGTTGLSGSDARWKFGVIARRGFDSVPVYFDFQGAWSRICGPAGSHRYPHALALGTDRSGPDEVPSLSRPQTRLLQGVVTRPFGGTVGGNDTGLHLGSVVRDLKLRRAIRMGLVERRGFLDPAVPLRYGGWSLNELLFVTGELTGEATAEHLLRQVVDRFRAAPFLFVSDGDLVLMGLCSPAPASVRHDRAGSLSEYLSTVLSSLRVSRGLVDELSTRVNHRYDRLVGGTPS
jgi:hypothetical protein